MNEKFLIVLDIDGTLLNSDGFILPQTKEILLNLESRGHKLVLASGRSYFRLMTIAKELELDKYNGYLVEINGNCLYDVANDKRERLYSLDMNQLSYLLSIVPNDIEITFHGDDRLFHIIPPDIYDLKSKIRKEMKLPKDYPWSSGAYSWFSDLSDGYFQSVVISDLSEIDCLINKLTLCQNEDYMKDFYPLIKERLSNEFQVALVSKRQIEITHLSANKGLGFKKLIDRFGLSDYKSVAFGDSGNDLDLAGFVDVFVAMGNGLDLVKERADYITDSHDDEGIYKFLKTYIKEG